jgi:hypothetical protein
MQMMPREAPKGVGFVELYTRETNTPRRWRVCLEVAGLLWWPEWEGVATDTQQATEQAREAFTRRLGVSLPLTVLSVHEVAA